MIGDGTGEPLAKISMVGMEVEERDDCTEEILDVLRLGVLTAAGIRFPPFGVALGGPLGIEFGTNAVDGRCRCPHSSGEDLAPLLLLNDPVIASSLHSSGQGGVTGWKKNPAIGHGQDLAIGGSDGFLRWSG